jgi:hypothetical protein
MKLMKLTKWMTALWLFALPTAHADVVTQYTYSITCQPSLAYASIGNCSTLENLYYAAYYWARTAPKPLAGSTAETPSIVLVSSATIPISAIFRFYHPPAVVTSHGTFYPPPTVSYFQPAHTGDPVTDTYAAAKLDRQVTSTRALKIHPIQMPASLGRANATSNYGIIREVKLVLVKQFSGIDFLWGLAGYHMPQVPYLTVIDQRTGEQHRIFQGDTITVEFTDGSTVAVALLKSSTGSLTFYVVAGSARNPAGQPYTIVAKPALPGNGATYIPSNSHLDGRQIGPSFSCQFPAGQVCTTDGNMTRCANTRAFIGPC